MKIIIKRKDECKYIQGDELDCAFCKYKNTDKCTIRKYRGE